MTNETRSIAMLTDQQLLAEVVALAQRERLATARLIAALAEMDARRLYLGEGYSSLFIYCTQRLHLSEHAAYGRIEAARAARQFPIILEHLAAGSLTLTTVCLLRPHLTAGNHVALLDAARGKSKREVEQQIAALHPLPAVLSSVRKIPPPRIESSAPAAALSHAEGILSSSVAEIMIASPQHVVQRDRPAALKPLAPERYRVQFTLTSEAHDKLRRAQDLLRHVVPSGDPAVIFDRALTLLLSELERRKLAATDRPRVATATNSRSRHVPAGVRREVWRRDGGRCGFVGAEGRCTERGFLEFHHVVPFTDGGPTTSANLQLRCRAHNLYEARDVLPLDSG